MPDIDTVIEGLQILRKYAPKADIEADHDIIYIGANINIEVSEEDAKRLDELNFSRNEEFDCWSRFT